MVDKVFNLRFFSKMRYGGESDWAYRDRFYQNAHENIAFDHKVDRLWAYVVEDARNAQNEMGLWAYRIEIFSIAQKEGKAWTFYKEILCGAQKSANQGVEASGCWAK